MNIERKISAGQKRHTPLFPSLHTSYFLKKEAVYLFSEYRMCLGLCTFLSFAVISVCFTLTVFAFYFKESIGLSTLTNASENILFYTFAGCISFLCLFVLFALFSGGVRSAYLCSKGIKCDILYAFENGQMLEETFCRYIVFLILNAICLIFPVLGMTVYEKNGKFDADTVIICTVCILTYLYLLCIISSVFAIMCCLNGEKRTSRAFSLLKGHVCEFIFLNIRLIPSVLLSVISCGVLHMTHTMPLIYASYACFASFAEDTEEYKKLLPKGNDKDEQ